MSIESLGKEAALVSMNAWRDQLYFEDLECLNLQCHISYPISVKYFI